MTELTLELELADNVDAEAFAERLQARLQALEDVDEVETQTEQSRGVAEAVAIVAAGIVLIDHGTAAANSLSKFVRALKELMLELGELKQAYIEVRGRKVELSELDEAELQALAE